MGSPENEEHYQLYKLLAFAIQELSWFANDRQISDTLSLPHPERAITNRARMAVERIEEQNPHFFAGYIAYRSNCKYPQVEEANQS